MISSYYDFLVAVMVFSVATNTYATDSKEATSSASDQSRYDPCCSFPCLNKGVCTSSLSSYECDCHATGFYGPNCEIPYFGTRVKTWLKPRKENLHYFFTHFQWLWKIVNNTTWLRRYLMKVVLLIRMKSIAEPSPYGALTNYPSWETYANKSMYVRTLPPVPQNCPTPMGIEGRKTLPDVDLLLQKFFRRHQFEPSPTRTSLLFPLFAQHFSHQFFKTDWQKELPHQWGQNSVDLSHIYGHTQERQHALRLHIDGKLKSSNIGGEMFPPLVEDAQVLMDGIDKVPQEYRFAIGHPGFTVQPPLLFFATLWLREHNRVCDVLKKEYPSWDDERFFQTTRLILIGETLKIIIEDYVQHSSGYFYKLIFDPEIIHDVGFSYHNEIALEFQLLYRWHSLTPDHIKIQDHIYAIRNLIFNPKPVVEAGMKTLAHDFSTQFAGKIVGLNVQGPATLGVAKQAIQDGRRLRLQPFNKYRESFGLPPYKNFYDFVGDTKAAQELELLYGDIGAVEFFVGLMLEQRRSHQLFGQSIAEIGSPYSLKGVFSNPIGSPAWWKPSTFGGKKGFDVVDSASLEKLICENIEGCPLIGFEVPDHVTYKPFSVHNGSNEDNSSHILKKVMRHQHVDDGVYDKPVIISAREKISDTEQESDRRPRTEL
ncbi:unnamed protein product [Clavelina lepadiformis]|uniref:prostaglandin-endoperoxide synthase n=1 Tax=Clavelina lepadiformis TaxID=159417 RepID=A0ABP0GYI8_CLALP